MKKAWIYYTYKTLGVIEDINQIENLESFCKQKKFEIAQITNEPDIKIGSAEEIIKKSIQNHKFEVLVVYSIDELIKDMSDYQAFIRDIVSLGASIEAVKEGILIADGFQSHLVDIVMDKMATA